MKYFILKILMFLLLLALLCGMFFLLPTPPRHAESLYFAALRKDSLLANTTSPRIIFIGGSNMNFGLNSQIIKDSLHLNPINTAIHAEIGLKYMLDNTLLYLKEGDIVVLAPNYEQFFRDWNKVTYELAFSVYEVDFPKIKLLNLTQINNSLQYVGQFFNSKITPSNYWYDKQNYFPNEKPVYTVNSFNKYGDTDAHWDRTIGLDSLPRASYDIIEYNPLVMSKIKEFEKLLQEKNCRMIIAYPALEYNAYLAEKDEINIVARDYQSSSFVVAGTPEKYLLPDSLMFNNVYHPLKIGVDKYTEMLVGDLKKVMNYEL